LNNTGITLLFCPFVVHGKVDGIAPMLIFVKKKKKSKEINKKKALKVVKLLLRTERVRKILSR
jgi:hypothetical protein